MSMTYPSTKHGLNFYKDNISNTKHPINNNLKMQIHHLLSKSIFESLPSSSKTILNKAEYNIDHVKNLVALPYHMQGACQLEVQLHRANHGDFDDGHDDNYHVRVEDAINEAIIEIKKSLHECKPNDTDAMKKKKEKENKKIVIKKMNRASRKMLRIIIKFKSFLTDVAYNFKEGECGCCGVGAEAKIDVIRAAKIRGDKCSQENRDGTQTDGHNRVVKSILKNKKYILKVGK